MRMDFSAKYRRSIRWHDGRPVLIRMDIDQLGIGAIPAVTREQLDSFALPEVVFHNQQSPLEIKVEQTIAAC